ncbi:MAG: 2-dehydro-3-deoxyglucarate aldolase [Burkholderiales bacterium]|nr:2-dehydro-3-deoxyglucarate aldolase [Burkholderiales bacterium]
MSTPTPPTPYRAFPNSFRRALREGRTLIGSWLSLGSPITAEVMGVAGFDWLLIDLEHAPNDVLSLIPQLMALKDSPSAPIVRPSWNDTVEIKRLLDAGAANLLIPFVENAEQARAAVAATRYPPQGVRGVSVSHRGNRYGAVAGYHAQANEEVAVLVQIENRSGVQAAGAIAAVEGVDALFIGPSDLAASYGHLGNPNHPEVQEAIAQVLTAAQAAGKPTGILAPAEADARRYLAQGMRFIGVGSDLGVLRMASQALADKYRDQAQGPLAAQY